ncbi:transcriptional regulator [Streptomyces sp. NPDC057910]|uniref:transcriptional regulator n=1 Tax=Streptomyces sp. NPDC057910 TaxID=3346278 RepID=UPI0036EF4450
MVSDTATIATFGAVFATLWAGNNVGDHWVQTTTQSIQKGWHNGQPGQSSRAGRLACTRHVISLTITKGIFMAAAYFTLDLPLTTLGLTVGFGLDALSHWWADRRTSLAWLAKATCKTEFYNFGTGSGPSHPVDSEGKPAAHLGTGAYALDQSFHALFLFIASLLIATL